MDVYTAETYLNKLHALVKKTAESNVRMYSKSRDRWRSMMFTCQDVVNLIANMLEEEALSEDDTDYNSDDISDILINMQTTLNTLSTFISGTPSHASQSSTTETDKISADTRREMLNHYHTVLKSAASIKYPVLEAQMCMDLLLNWFEVRFIESPKTNKYFHYNIRRLPQWICDIILIFGKHCEYGDLVEFLGEFNLWLSNCYKNEKLYSYSIPYEVYKADTALNVNDITLSSCVLYDILLDGGLRELSEYSDEYLHDSCLYNITAKIKPECLDKYSPYTVDNSVIKYTSLTMRGESND